MRYKFWVLLMFFVSVVVAPLKGQAGERLLALDNEVNFPQFFEKYKKLKGKEQLQYIAVPFTTVTLVPGKKETDDPVENKKTYPTQQKINELTREWQSILLSDQELKKYGVQLFLGPSSSGTGIVFMGQHPNAGIDAKYTFKRIKNAWRLVEFYENQSGI